jgi:apolipoprotein D and lipocalin family protein
MQSKVFLGLTLLAGGAFAFWRFRPAIPQNAAAVEDFDVRRYLGTWYEIARLDYIFERDVDNAVAQYSLNDNGTINVVNSGYNHQKREWVSAKGVAKFRGSGHIAALKVSFFGPFYAGYNVIALDADYKYALVAGRNLNYLWMLSRTKTIPDKTKNVYLALAEKVGYDTSQLIWVNQDKNNPYVSNPNL